MAELQAMTALGAAQAAVVTAGPLSISERMDVALASVAVRRGHDLAEAARSAGVPLPEPARHAAGFPYSAFWVAPGMWFVEAPFASHEQIAELLATAFGPAASVTEQTDAWAVLDLTAPDLAPVLERLCNVDFRGVPDGHACRTVIDHLGCYLIRLGQDQVRLYGPRSSARSLLHALEAAAAAC